MTKEKQTVREIRFRAWDKINEELIYSNCFPSMWQFFKGLENRGIRHWEVDLFTTLRDKNGKEVYDRDLIKRGGNIYRVYWHVYTACWRLAGVSVSRGTTGITKSDMGLMCEVIGNIYENPQ